MIIGRGNMARFWEDNWCGNGSLASIAPNLYQCCTRKNKTVSEMFPSDTWVRCLRGFSSMEQILEFGLICATLQDAPQLSDGDDTISWTLTKNGCYSASSAYRIQFAASHPTFKPKCIWKSIAEPKARVFSWELANKKILTADNLQKRGWPHSAQCALCFIHPETVQHLAIGCYFTREVWTLICGWFDLNNLPLMHDFDDPMRWWEASSGSTSKLDRRRVNGLIAQLLWNVWKERNRRTFQHKFLGPLQIAYLVKDEVDLLCSGIA